MRYILAPLGLQEGDSCRAQVGRRPRERAPQSHVRGLVGPRRVNYIVIATQRDTLVVATQGVTDTDTGSVLAISEVHADHAELVRLGGRLRVSCLKGTGNAESLDSVGGDSGPFGFALCLAHTTTILYYRGKSNQNSLDFEIIRDILILESTKQLTKGQLWRGVMQ